MSTTTVLHVGNLSPVTDDHDLGRLFAEHGTVRRAAITVDQRTDRSAETGTVEMECDREAQAAIDALHGRAYCGRVLVVTRATGRQVTNAAHTSMFESMNVPDASELDTTRGPRPGGFGDRGGKGTGGALYYIASDPPRPV